MKIIFTEHMRLTEVCEANLGRGSARAEPVNRGYVGSLQGDRPKGQFSKPLSFINSLRK